MEDLVKIIGLLYEATLDEEKWPEAMRAMERHFGAHASALHITGEDHGEILDSNIDPLAKETYNEWFWREDPWLEKAQALKPGTVTTGASLCPREDIPRDVTAVILDPCEIQDLLTVKLQVGPDWQAYSSVYRPVGKELFTRLDMAQMAVLAPHLARAVRIKETLAAQAQISAELDEAFYRLHVAALLVDDVMRIAWRNQKADHLLVRYANPAVPVMASRLSLGSDSDQDAVLSAVLRAIHTGGGSDLIVRAVPGGEALLVEVVPLSNRLYEEKVSSWVPAGRRRRCLVTLRELSLPAGLKDSG